MLSTRKDPDDQPERCPMFEWVIGLSSFLSVLSKCFVRAFEEVGPVFASRRGARILEGRT